MSSLSVWHHRGILGWTRINCLGSYQLYVYVPPENNLRIHPLDLINLPVALFTRLSCRIIDYRQANAIYGLTLHDVDDYIPLLPGTHINGSCVRDEQYAKQILRCLMEFVAEQGNHGLSSEEVHDCATKALTALGKQPFGVPPLRPFTIEEENKIRAFLLSHDALPL